LWGNKRGAEIPEKQQGSRLQQFNYDVKLMWIASHVGIVGNEVADGLARQAVESGIVHGQMTVANDHRILADKQR
jgi:ribonuclease HI